MGRQYKETRLSMRYFVLAIPGLMCLVGTGLWALKMDKLHLKLYLFAGVGLALVLLSMRELTQTKKRLASFISGNSTFEHPCAEPVTASSISDKLKHMGFSIAYYPTNNYYCVKQIGKGHQYVVFVQNYDNQDDAGDEAFFERYVKETFKALSPTGVKKMVLKINIGEVDIKGNPGYTEQLREGFSAGNLFSVAFDTSLNILYLADAIKLVEWRKNNVMEKYTVELMTELFGV